jgi:hypothetical protein
MEEPRYGDQSSVGWSLQSADLSRERHEQNSDELVDEDDGDVVPSNILLERLLNCADSDV